MHTVYEEQLINDAAAAVVCVLMEKIFWIYPRQYRASLAAAMEPIVRAGMEALLVTRRKKLPKAGEK
jgi:hypothetical protein